MTKTPEEKQFIFNQEKDRVECRCGHPAVKMKGGYVCGTITAYPCEYVRQSSVVKEKTPEEKAREYAMESPYYRLFEFFLQEHDLILLDGQIQDVIYEVQEYLEKQSTEMEFVSSQNISGLYRASLIVIEEQKQEVKELREALKEIVLLEEIIIGVSNIKRDVLVSEMESFLAKAKQLIKK